MKVRVEDNSRIWLEAESPQDDKLLRQFFGGAIVGSLLQAYRVKIGLDPVFRERQVGVRKQLAGVLYYCGSCGESHGLDDPCREDVS